MSASHFDIMPRRGWVCPLCGKTHNPVLMTCPCHGGRADAHEKAGITEGTIVYPVKEKEER